MISHKDLCPVRLGNRPYRAWRMVRLMMRYKLLEMVLVRLKKCLLHGFACPRVGEGSAKRFIPFFFSEF